MTDTLMLNIGDQVRFPINYRLPSNRASDDDDDDDDDPKMFFKNRLKLEYFVTDGLYFHFIQQKK